MKKGQSKKTKTRYFKKDYAPARAMANQRKALAKSRSSSSKVATSVKKLASNTSKTIQKTAKNLSARAKSSRNHQSKSYRKSPARKLAWPEITLLSLIGTSAIAIIFSIAFTVIFDPVKRSERELDKLADAYYVEYLYPRALGGKFDQAETILKDFTTQGLPSVRLRQLLYFNEDKYSSSAEAFSNPYYQCDTNKSYIRYYPIAPYGPRDYTVYYGTSCEKIGLAD